MHRTRALLAALTCGAVCVLGCDGSHFDEERIAAPAAYDERGGEIVSHGDRASDERTIASLCPHGHVTGAARSIVVAVQLVPHPIGESSPLARDRVPVVERRVPFTCTSPPVAPASASAPDAGDDAALPNPGDSGDAGANGDAAFAL